VAENSVDDAFKQADWLGYRGAAVSGDCVGWHTHNGESAVFAVLLHSGNTFEGGVLHVRTEDGAEPTAVPLERGDVVFCRSETEHMVTPVVKGDRASVNVDFWMVRQEDDRRSHHDRV
jgi:predicted 2-oxoglutarate/Fe(II)-dependent dioxygenase YbiX